MERNYSLFLYRQEISSSSINTLPSAQGALELCNTHQNMEKRLFRNRKRDKIQIKVGKHFPGRTWPRGKAKGNRDEKL